MVFKNFFCAIDLLISYKESNLIIDIVDFLADVAMIA